MPRELYRAQGGTWSGVPVAQAPQSPNFTHSPDPDNGLSVTFAGTAAGGTTPYTWAWTFGDGGTASGQNPVHVYAAAGDYLVTMTVRGADNRSNQRSKTITVTATGGGGGGAFPTIFGSSMKTPAAAAPNELAEYKAIGNRVALLNYFDGEMRQLTGWPENPLINAFHSYDTTIPASVQASAFMADSIANGWVIVNNCSASDAGLVAGNWDAAIASLCASIRANVPITRPTYLVINHEPENDGARDRAAWRAGVAQFSKVVLENRGSHLIYPTVCHISFTFANLAEADTWNPGPEMVARGVDLSQVCMAPDGYATEGNVDSTTPTRLFDKCYNRMRTWGFSRFGISEVACKSYLAADRALAPAWVDSLAQYADARQLDYVCWFFSDVGNRAGTEGWYMYSDEQKRRFGNACHYRGFGS